VTEQSITTPTDQPSSGNQSQSTPGQSAANDGSNLTQDRPEYVPESFWDPEAKAVKAKEFGEHLTQLSELKAERDARLAARPENPDGYELEFPKDFKPEIPIAFDANDPRVGLLNEFAHKHNWTQDEYSEALTIEAQKVAADYKAMETAAEVEKQKLGANGVARTTAVKTFLAGLLGADRAQVLMDRMVLASDVEVLEALQTKITNPGSTNFNGGGRDTSQPMPEIPTEKLFYPSMHK
jgi:hypothetical protein